MIIYEPINNNGDVRKIDTSGVVNYISWFDNQLSANLWYYKRLLVESTATVTVKLNSENFFLYDTTVGTTEEIVDSSRILKSELTVQSSAGVLDIYIVCHAEEPGEFITTLQVGDDEVLIGAEVYDENEVLGIELSNKGIEIPTDVGRAIYNTDLYEERPDWITLNNKWRELLINYMDIAGCKGNYKSLQNSLEWFNYGRLVELRECWKVHTEDGIKLADKPLNKEVEQWYEQSISTIAKTTYMVLRHCSIDLDSTPEYGLAPALTALDSDEYEFNQSDKRVTVPAYSEYDYDPALVDEKFIEKNQVKWSKDEMRLKMQLLGLFFETNFMPVHLDLLRSTVEDFYFDIPYIVLSDAIGTTETTNIANGDAIIYTYGNDKEPDVDDYDLVLHLDQQSVWGSGEGINFGATGEDNDNENKTKIIGVTREAPNPIGVSSPAGAAPSNPDMLAFSNCIFNSIGAVAEFDVITPSEITEGSIIIWEEREGNRSIRGAKRGPRELVSTEATYKVDPAGNIINYNPITIADNAIWDRNAVHFKYISENKYAKVDQFGFPIDDKRYLSIEEIPSTGDGEKIEWYDSSKTYYTQINDNEYVIVDTSGRPISDIIEGTPESGWVEWKAYDPANIYYIQTSHAKYVFVNDLGQRISDIIEGTPESGWVEWKEGLTFTRNFYRTPIKLLFEKPGAYNVSMTLDGTQQFTKTLRINVIDNVHVYLQFYKLVARENLVDPFAKENLPPNRNMFTTTKGNLDPQPGTTYDIPNTFNPEYQYQQYLDLRQYDNDNPDKPFLAPVYTIQCADELMYINNASNFQFFLDIDAAGYFYKFGQEYNSTEDKTGFTYLQFTPKTKSNSIDFANFQRLSDLLSNCPDQNNSMLRFVKYTYIPEEHQLAPIIEDIVTYPVVVVPRIELEIEGNTKDLTWSLKLNSPAWKFYSYKTCKYESFVDPNIQQPFMASKYKQPIPTGKYKVSFSWRWGGKIHTTETTTPFRIG